MRILYSHRIGSRDGQGVHLEEMVAALRAEGHEVLVVGPPSYGQGGWGGDSRAVSLARRLLPGAAGETAELAYNAAAYRRLARAARSFAPDVIYERANLFHLAGALLSRRLNLPLLLEVNAPLAEERGRHGGLRLARLARVAEGWTWRAADRVLPVTEVLAVHVAAAGVPRARVTVIPNGIRLSDFPEPARGEAGGTLTLGFVGFVRAWHGLDRVVRGLASWRGSPALHLRVVGDGPAREGLEALAASLGVADRCTFDGAVDHADIPGLVAAFDVALQPAAVDYASPLKVFEYMAAGRAIVAPDQPNLREVLEDDRTALLFDRSDEGALWRAVARLAEDPALRARLGHAARAEVFRRDLTWAGNARRVVALAEAEIARRAGRPAPVAPSVALS